MLVPLRWIKDYTNTDANAKTLAKAMEMTGTGVEKIIDIGADIENVVVGKILKIEKHPNADKLVVCTVDVNEGEPLQIVTGANNVFEGAYVPVAKAGSMLPGGPIKKGRLRGVDSYGMLCSGEELNLKEEDYKGAGTHGILILEGEPAPGTDIRELLNLRGEVISFEIGANRPDCLSVVGIAREAAAALNAEFKLPPQSYTETPGNRLEDYVSVEVDAPDLCTRYLAAAVTDVKIEPSPDWMRLRLKEAGIRPINNIVDITNYVMLETGQPMHAFDAADIRGGKIIVRRAKKGETITTLDDKTRSLTADMLLICDNEGPIGIAGVMGGQNSQIKPDTKTVIFESAKFAYGNIRQTSRGLGLATESSMRFSKGVDAANSLFALQRALTLVQQLNAGKVCQNIIDVLNEEIAPAIIKTSGSKINSILGTNIPVKDMSRLLNRVFIQSSCIGDELICTVPSYRGDISGANDIAEEVARIYGYDNIAPTVPRVAMRRGRLSQNEISRDKIKRYLADNGFFECSTYSFAGESDYKKLGINVPESVKIRNPLGDDTCLMRATAVPQMLRVVSSNLNRKNTELNLFEATRVFSPREGEKLPDEGNVLVLAQSGNGRDFYTLKGVVEQLSLLITGRRVSCERGEAPYLHPGKCAAVSVGGVCIGVMGEVSPTAAAAFELAQPVYIAEINLDALCGIQKAKAAYKAIPKQPAAKRDIALIVDEETGAGDIINEIIRASEKIESAALFDVYAGDKIGSGKKSLAYTVTLNAGDNPAEADKIISRVLKRLEEKFGAKLRDM